jgi:hypothetical protein
LVIWSGFFGVPRSRFLDNLDGMSFLSSTRLLVALALLAALPVHADATAAPSQTGKDPYNSPIDFWGKVVDEKGNPVEGATATFIINISPDTAHESTVTVPSDAAGLFSLTGKRGRGIAVSVAKDGYASTSGSFNLNYSLKGKVEQPFPTQKNPSLFELQKKGAVLDLIYNQMVVPLTKAGAPLDIDLATGKLVAESLSDVKIENWVTGRRGDAAQPLSWKCRVTAIAGGLQLRSDPLAFEAPSSGYTPQDEFTLPAADAPPGGDMVKQYFLAISGNRHARITLWLISGKKNSLRIEYYLNSQPGDPNLKPVN